MAVFTVVVALLAGIVQVCAFHSSGVRSPLASSTFSSRTPVNSNNKLQMNFVSDAFRFFTNMNKEASAKHILLKGSDAMEKLQVIKEELAQSQDLNTAFSEMASKVSECPSAARGGNLGTFKPGMMVKEFDEVVFGEKVGVVHGPIKTQFGAHLILITRRYEGEGEKK